MTIEYKLPDLGEDIETGDVIGVFVSAGDKVTEDQALLEVETDKAAIEIPSPAEGIIKEVHVNEGETIKVGQILVTIDDGKGNGSDIEVEEVTNVKTQDEAIEEIAEREVEEEMNADPEPDQELITSELEDELETQDSEDNSTETSPASPSMRRLARELDVDINSVQGSGPGGRISEEDIRNSAKDDKPKAKKQESKTTKTKKQDSSEKTDVDKWGNIERTPMSKVRTLTAERLTEAWTAPHVTQYDKADITELEKLRKGFGRSVQEAGGKLTTTSILLKVIASALEVFPQFNASVDMENGEIIYKQYYNIGVAVDTERGLLVPVIKNVDEKDILDLSVELTELSDKARNKKISVEELQGGTFTISNLGGIGGTYFSPVINAPEVAILGISRSTVEPVYIDEEFLPRLMLPLSLSYDHRLIDGADAIRFLRWIIDTLEDPLTLSLED